MFNRLSPFQPVRKGRRRLLKTCKTLIGLGDEGPYQNMLEALADLRVVVDPDKVPSRVRKDARRLRSILKGVHGRMESFACRRFAGLAQLLYTEISGHGGLAVFRRMDAHNTAYEKVVGKASSGSGEGVGYGRGGGGARVGQGRGGPRGGGGARRNLAGVQCFHCFRRGHLRADCPGRDRDRAPAPHNANGL